MTERRVTLHCPDHPLATRGGRVRRARVVLHAKMDGDDGPCHWCGRLLAWTTERGRPDGICADHLDRDTLNDDPENLVPACRGCNAHRSHRITERLCEWCGEPFRPARAAVLLSHM